MDEKSDSQPSEKAPRAAKRTFASRFRAPRSTAASKENGVPPNKAAAQKQPKQKGVGLFELFRFSTRLEAFLDIIGLICAIGAGAAQPLMSLIFSKLVASFVNFGVAVSSGNEQLLRETQTSFKTTAAQDALYIVYIGIGMLVATYGYMIIWTYTGEMNAKRVRELYLQSILRQEIAFFDTLGAGEVTTRIQSDTAVLQRGISEKVPLSISYFSGFITGYIVAYVRNWRLALALTSILPCVMFVGTFMVRWISQYMRRSLIAVAESGTLAEQVISSIRTTKAFGAQETLAKLYDVQVAKSHVAEAKASLVQGVGMGISFFLMWNEYALAFFYGSELVYFGIGDVGTVVNVFMALVLGSFNLMQSAPELRAIAEGRAAAAKLFSTIDRVPVIDSSSTTGLRPATVEGNIVLDDVSFTYPSRPDVPILKNISQTFIAGQNVALVGASGSGKSTIVNLVERFYDPKSGSVKLDGVDLRDLNIKWLRSQIGLVSQEPTLFNTSVRENVSYGLIGTPFENASEEEKFKLIKEACVEANADGFISNLPQGYETNVGQAGLMMSGGQKQRIAIARAIVSNPRILLLDEATSALDTQSEGIVQNALDKASRGRTTITIAHRLSTIRYADKIYVMGGGVVLEEGTHDSLLDLNGAYAQYVRAQQLRERQTTPGKGDSGVPEAVDEKAGGEPAPAFMMTDEEAERVAKEERVLARVNSDRSLASEILEERRQHGLLPGDQEPREYSSMFLFKRMGALNRESSKYYVLGLAFSIVVGMIFPVVGIVYGTAIQGFQQTGEALRQAGSRDALWFFIIAIVSAISMGSGQGSLGKASATLSRNLRAASFRAILRQDVTWFDEERHGTGTLTSYLAENPQKISGLGGSSLGVCVQSIATVLGGPIIGLCYGWKLALVGIACIPFVISSGLVRLQVVVLKDKKNRKAYAQSATLACEAAAAIRTVQSLTREEHACKQYQETLEAPIRNSHASSIYSTLLYAISQSLSFLVIAFIFWYGSTLIASLEYGTQAFFVTMMSVIFGAISAGNVFARVPDISNAKSGATDAVNILDSEPEIDTESLEGDILNDVKGQLELTDVHFRYPTRPGVRVLRNLSVIVRPGETVALCGASGCGKSTVIQLIERFYDPLAGTVSIDGMPLTRLNVQEYRKHIALVSQEPTLYAGTIRFNILLGANKPAEEVTPAELEDACRNANILDFIQSLPDGFETQVGNKGTSLSGGQKQRIAIARALIRNPKVLLLDEATSALDSQSERVVQDALDKAARGRTTIAIAHRLSTIQNADRIYFLKDGRVAEVGTHDELLTLRGGYFELVQLQALSHG